MATYLYKTPTEDTLQLSRTHPLLKRYAIPQGISVVKRGGAWTTDRVLSGTEVRANGWVEGVDFFIGGCEYEITDEALVAELQAAGIGTVSAI